MKIYLAGPMRGYPDFNFPAFHEAAADLRSQGYVVFSPAENSQEAEFAASLGSEYDPSTGSAGPSASRALRFFMRTDLPAVLDSDALAVLDGWQASVGSQVEAYVAFACGIPVKAYESGIPFVDAYEFSRYAHPHISKPT